MNSYFFNIEGELWLLVLAILLAVAITLFTYKNTIPAISNSQKSIFVVLRSVGLVALIFMLFEPSLNKSFSEKIQPRTAYFIDNSISVGLENHLDSNNSEIKNMISELNIANNLENADVYFFDNETILQNNFNLDSLKFNGTNTNISSAVEKLNIYSPDDNLSAAVIISDGNFNSGANPIYAAQMQTIPIFTLGIGDTNKRKDLVLNKILTNDVLYKNNSTPIVATVKSTGINSDSIKITLSEDGKEIASRFINFKKSENLEITKKIIFDYVPEKAGVKKLKIAIENIDGEFTHKNNSASTYLKVLENKRNIAIFSGSPSHDLSFISQYWKDKKEIDLKKFIQKNGPEFYNIPTNEDLANSELIILCGFPNSNSPVSLVKLIAKEAKNGKPILFISSFDIDYKKLKILEPVLPFSVISHSKKEFKTNIFVDEKDISHPILRLTGSESDLGNWNNLPPMFKSEVFVSPKIGAKTLARLQMNNSSVIDEPMILAKSSLNQKSVAILFYGLSRMKLLAQGEKEFHNKNNLQNQNDVFTLFMDNLFTWLSVQNNKEKLVVESDKKIYSSGEKIEIRAKLLDESFRPLSGASIKVSIKSGEETRQIILSEVGQGLYQSFINAQKEGEYSLSANANFQGKSHASANNRFAVGVSEVEYLQTRLNNKLLEKISSISSGKFYFSSDVNLLAKDLDISNFKEKIVQQQKKYTLWDNEYLLVLALLMFSVEWYLRKKAGLL
jgi:hypothetical protein